MCRRIHTLVLLAALVLATGCSIYHPQAVDIPLINHAGDLRADASLAVSALVVPDVLTGNLTFSYGVNDWLAGQVHVNYGGENFYFQLAPGAYLPLGENGLLEGYAGIGLGGAWRKQVQPSANDTTRRGGYDYAGRFSVPFGQVNIGWHDLGAAHIDLALGLKAGAYSPQMRYRKFDADGNLLPSEGSSYSTPSFLFEPQFVFRIGGESVKFCLRGSFAWLSDFMGNNTSGTSSHFSIDLFTLSAGVNFTF